MMSHTTLFILESMFLAETIGTCEFTQWQVLGSGAMRDLTEIPSKLRELDHSNHYNSHSSKNAS